MVSKVMNEVVENQGGRTYQQQFGWGIGEEEIDEI